MCPAGKLDCQGFPRRDRLRVSGGSETVNGNGCIEPTEGTSAPNADAGLIVKIDYVAGQCDFDLNGMESWIKATSTR